MSGLVIREFTGVGVATRWCELGTCDGSRPTRTLSRRATIMRSTSIGTLRRARYLWRLPIRMRCPTAVTAMGTNTARRFQTVKTKATLSTSTGPRVPSTQPASSRCDMTARRTAVATEWSCSTPLRTAARTCYHAHLDEWDLVQRLQYCNVSEVSTCIVVPYSARHIAYRGYRTIPRGYVSRTRSDSQMTSKMT